MLYLVKSNKHADLTVYKSKYIYTHAYEHIYVYIYLYIYMFNIYICIVNLLYIQMSILSITNFRDFKRTVHEHFLSH